ncbi:MAG TPA: hypothetical protein VK196_03915, partial [Magnetospirillum sp.]|nr:hypothetical protein [Magnetospirillum sp.]
EGAAPAYGWTEETVLARAGFQTFLGDGVVVRPQAPPRYDLAPGLRACLTEVTAAQLAGHNRVGAVAGIVAGWLDTTLPFDTRSVAVHVRHGAGQHESAAAVVVAIDGDDAPRPAAHIATHEGSVLVFAVQPGTAPTVRTRDNAHAVVTGVLGHGDTAAAAETDLNAASFGIRLGAGPAPAAKVLIVSEPIAAEAGR